MYSLQLVELEKDGGRGGSIRRRRMETSGVWPLTATSQVRSYFSSKFSRGVERTKSYSIFG